MVDPFSLFGGEVDMHRSNQTRPILDGLATLAEKYRVCMLILRHFAKSTTGSAINRGLGSIDLTGAARTELHAGKRDEQSAMVHAKSNIGEIGKSIGYEISTACFAGLAKLRLRPMTLHQPAEWPKRTGMRSLKPPKSSPTF